MTARKELKSARHEIGLCAIMTCGNKAFLPWGHCKKHIPDRNWIARLAADRNDTGPTGT